METLIGLRSQGWSASDMRDWPKQKKMHRHLVSPTGVLLLVFWLVQSQQYNYQVSDLPKVIKITTKFFDLSKVSKNTKKQPFRELPCHSYAYNYIILRVVCFWGVRDSFSCLKPGKDCSYNRILVFYFFLFVDMVNNLKKIIIGSF